MASKEGRKRKRDQVDAPEEQPIAEALKKCQRDLSTQLQNKFLKILQKDFLIKTVGDWTIQTATDKDKMADAGLLRVVIAALDKYMPPAPVIPTAQNFPSSHRPRGEQTVLAWDGTLYNEFLKASVKQLDSSKPTMEVLEKAGSPWPGMDENRLLIRQWNIDFWSTYKTNLTTSKVAIIGTPGIGKTVGLCYVLWKYLNAAGDPAVSRTRYIVLILPNAQKFYLFDTEGKVACEMLLKSQEQLLTVLEPYLHKLLILHDLGKDSPMTSNELPTVLATSPKYQKYNEFMKGNDERFYVPPFSDEEMNFAATSLYPKRVYTRVEKKAQRWQDLAYYFGNVPRDVFLGKAATLQEMNKQLDAVKKYDLEEIEHLIDTEPTDKVNDRVVIYKAAEDYGDGCIRFREGYVAGELAKALIFRKLSEWHKIVRFTQNGHVFETVLHEFLATFPSKLDVNSIKLLQPGKTGATVAEQGAAQTKLRGMWPNAGAWTPIMFYPLSKVTMKTQHYYYPNKPNFAVIDSFVFCHTTSANTANLLCFQMTIASEHQSTASKLEEFINEFNQVFRYEVKKTAYDAKITVDNSGKATLEVGPTKQFKLEIHLVYVTNNQDDSFGYQKLITAKGDSTKWTTFWNGIKQYHSGPPSL